MVGADNNSEGDDYNDDDSDNDVITGDNLSISSSVLPDPFQDALKLDADKYFLPFRWQDYTLDNNMTTLVTTH